MAFVGGNRTISFRDGEGRPIDITNLEVMSANTFALLGVKPILGRDFIQADELPGAPPVTILSYEFWQRRFGKRDDIVGSIVHMNGAPATIIGVMPEGFVFPYQQDLWLPLEQTPELHQRGPRGYIAVGRLRDDATLQQVRAEIETINRRLEAAYPETNRGVVPTVGTHATFMSGEDAVTIFGSLWAGACLVLMIACANLANLMLVRTIGRWRDFSARIALGAGQVRMVRQLLLEGLVLASCAGALGWWITKWAVRQWASATAAHYQVLNYTVDSGILTYVAAISVAAAILCSLVPIWRVMHLGVSGVLKGDARGVTQGLRGRRLAKILVSVQMTLAIVLLSGAGVLVRSFTTIVSANVGVHDPEHVLVGSVRLPSEKYPSASVRNSYFDRLEAQLRTVPGVEDASVASGIPVYGGGLRTLEIEGRLKPADGDESAVFLDVGSSYFRVLKAPAIAGREFNDDDRAAASAVAIVNQSFVDRFWPGEQPLGKRLRSNTPNTRREWRTVVGIVPNIMQGDAVRQTFKPVVYFPITQEPAPPRMYFLLRTPLPPERVAQTVRLEVEKLDSDVLLTDFAALKAHLGFKRDNMDAEHSELGKEAAAAPIFALIALMLAAIGLVAVIGQSVSQRTKEIGVRMAIGAVANDIRRMILREGMLPVAIGTILGLTFSLAVNRILQSQLVGVAPNDPVTMTGATVVLIVVALLACQIPARRAMNVDPAVALRHD